MIKDTHEFRDPIHTFIRLYSREREVVDSRPFQRLRHIHQLALTYLVYPGATHRRFEHSIGVVELATRVFDVITNKANVRHDVRDTLKEIANEDDLKYWRRVLRMAALCHDIGHIPFSHAAESELLPDGWDHEKLTRKLIESPELRGIWESSPPIKVEDVVKLTLGKKKAKDLTFTYWEEILAEIITGNALGVDRMDYLLRDSHHTGVAYGKFDHHRLIDTLRILPPAPTGRGASSDLGLGVEEGGLQSVEALLLARYFMFSQVYYHPIRRAYDIHLKDFLKAWLPDGHFSTDINKHIAITDNEVTAALLSAGYDDSKDGHLHAKRIVCRGHFKVFYQRHPSDTKINPEPGQAIYKAIGRQFGLENVRHDRYTQKGGSDEFPVEMRDARIESSTASSTVLQKLPVFAIDYVFVNRSCFDEAKRWFKEHRDDIVKPPTEGENDG